MQKTPASRYSSCAEVIDALRPFAPASGPVRTRPTMTIPRLAERRTDDRRRREDARRPDPRARTTGPLPPRAPSAAAPKRGPPPPSDRRPRRRRSRPLRRNLSRSSAAQRRRPRNRHGAKSLGQRMGALGFVLLALLAGAVAWLVCNLVLPK